ncbi:MAG: hypothetical protein ACLGIK_07035 [Gemmatimonadota bacterium]
MLNYRDLTALATDYRERQVLTVYLHTTVENPADRNMWQAELDHALDALREKVKEPATRSGPTSSARSSA